jgi:hypothetical protein
LEIGNTSGNKIGTIQNQYHRNFALIILGSRRANEGKRFRIIILLSMRVAIPRDTISEERFDAQVGPTDKSMIVSGKKKKKYYDKQGNLITDPELIKDIRQGKT